jgi:hypothetical protein
VQKLWRHTVAALPADTGLEGEAAQAYKLFADLCARGAVAPADLEPLIAPGAAHQPPQSMTLASLEHYYSIVVLVNQALGLIQESTVASPDMPKHKVASGGKRLVGFDYLYEARSLETHLLCESTKFVIAASAGSVSCSRSWCACFIVSLSVSTQLSCFGDPGCWQKTCREWGKACRD